MQTTLMQESVQASATSVEVPPMTTTAIKLCQELGKECVQWWIAVKRTNVPQEIHAVDCQILCVEPLMDVALLVYANFEEMIAFSSKYRQEYSVLLRLEGKTMFDFETDCCVFVSIDGSSCAEAGCLWDETIITCATDSDPCSSLSKTYCNTAINVLGQRMCRYEDRCVDECDACNSCIEDFATVVESSQNMGVVAISKVLLAAYFVLFGWVI